MYFLKKLTRLQSIDLIKTYACRTNEEMILKENKLNVSI